MTRVPKDLHKIRIVPEWNVNRIAIHMYSKYCSIRIVPEWNVNKAGPYWFDRAMQIRIVPEWNVNFFTVTL